MIQNVLKLHISKDCFSPATQKKHSTVTSCIIPHHPTSFHQVTGCEGQQQQWQQLIHRGQDQLLRDLCAAPEAPRVKRAVVTRSGAGGEGHVGHVNVAPGNPPGNLWNAVSGVIHE